MNLLGFALVCLWCSSEAFKTMRIPTVRFLIPMKCIKGSVPFHEKLIELVLQVFACCCHCCFYLFAQWPKWHDVLSNKVFWGLVFLDDKGAKIRAGSGFWFLSGLHWLCAISISELYYVGGARVALGAVGQGFGRSWQGQSCAPGPAASVPEQWHCWGRVTCPVCLRVDAGRSSPAFRGVQAAFHVALLYEDFLLCKLQVAKDGHA